MKRSRVAKRYAKAIFEAALELKSLDQLEADFESLGKSYDESQEFRNLLNSPVVPNDTKSSVFAEIFEKRLSKAAFQFVSLLISKNREALLPQVIEDFRRLADQHRGIVRGSVHSVLPLSASQLKTLKSKMDKITGKDVVFTQEIDESLLGGVLVQIGDTVYDASLRNQLGKLRENLIQS